MAERTPADVIREHTPRHGYACWPCRLPEGDVCDAYLMAQAAEQAIRWAVILDGRWAVLRETVVGPFFDEHERARLRGQERGRERRAG